MKKILSVSALICVVLLSLASCKKHHDCNCDIKTVTDDNGDTVKSTTSHHTIYGTIDDAEDACKYYETEESHLGRAAVVYHYCSVGD